MPRFFFLAALLLALMPARSAAQPAAAVRAFEDGNRLYVDQDYVAALAAYERAAQTGYVSGALYYNMAGAYYRTGARGQAIRYYEKAHRLLPHDERLRHNLALVRSQVEGDTPSAPPPFAARLSRQISARVGPGVLFGLGLALYLGALGLAAYWIWTRGWSAQRRRAPAAAGTAGVLLVAVAFAVSAGRASSSRAVVLTDAAALRAEPDGAAEPQTTLREGRVLNVLRQRGDWTRIRQADGTTGWLPDSTLGAI